MPKLQLIEVVESSSTDINFPAENLIQRRLLKWLSSKTSMSYSIHATFRLAKLSTINRIDFGNAGSASVTVLVSRSGSTEFKELLPPTEIMSESDFQQKVGATIPKICTLNSLRKETRHMKWDLLKIICYNPYRRTPADVFGLNLLTVYGCTEDVNCDNSPGKSALEKFKESAIRNASLRSPVLRNLSCLSRGSKLYSAAMSPPNKSEAELRLDAGNKFKESVLKFLDTNTESDLAAAELRKKYEDKSGRELTPEERTQFMTLFVKYFNVNGSRKPSGILTPRSNNRQIVLPCIMNKPQDSKLSILKPQLDECYIATNNPLVYRAEVVHNGPFITTTGKENTPFLKKDGRESLSTPCPSKKGVNSDRKLSLEKQTNGKFSPKETWKNQSEVTSNGCKQFSPDSWLKRKSDSSERPSLFSKKRLRGAVNISTNNESPKSNGIITSDDWLENTDQNKTGLSPQQKCEFPYRVSPPPPPDRPSSPLPLVDDVDRPSTSSKETVAERNIRLEKEKRLKERSPTEKVVQRTSAGKVKGTYCTKGMNTNESPLRRLSICEEVGEDSPQARRKLNFPRQNGHIDMVQCPICGGFYESSEINGHLDDCVPSSNKRPEDEEDDMMACPICGLIVGKDTVAAHADECAQKRYGA